MKTRRNTSPVVCEACETRRALRPQPERIPDDPFLLCQRCSDRLDRLSLRPLEWYNLAKRHGPHGPVLGEEFYSPGGVALWSNDELEEEPHLLPAPILQDVAHDLRLLWGHTLTRRHLGPKLLAAWRRHPKADVAAHLIQTWESRKDRHARGHLLTLCRDCLGRAGADLARRAYQEHCQPGLNTPLTDSDIGSSETDDDDGDDTPQANTQSRPYCFYLHAGFRLPSVIARCLPREEAYQLILAEVERSGHAGWFTVLHDPRVLDWIETHIQPSPTDGWGRLAATSGFSWGRALRWLQQGRPLSHAALEALKSLIFPMGDPCDDSHGPRLLDPPSRRTLSRVLKAHALRDPVPRVENTVAFVLEHAPVLLEGKPYDG